LQKKNREAIIKQKASGTEADFGKRRNGSKYSGTDVILKIFGGRTHTLQI